MTKASDNVFPRLLISEGGSTSTPAAAQVTVYAKANGLLYSKDDAGTETALGGAAVSVATDAIWDAAGDLAVGSGANTAAVLGKGAAGGALSMINAGVAWNSGTSFPGSKATGDRYWRTDLGMECYWDGTQWVTTQEYTLSLPPILATITGPSTNSRAAGPATTGYAWYITRLEFVTYVITTNDGSNYWGFQLQTFDGGTGPTNLGSAVTTASDSADGYVPHSTTTVAGALAVTVDELQLDIAKTSSPGTLIAPAASVVYRKIVT